MPSKQTVARVIEHIKAGGAPSGYVFDTLPSPQWITPFMQAGLFRDPPAPRLEGEGVVCDPWPASRYLARMAAVDPDAVLSAIKGIPSTENFLVNRDIVEAALLMPVEHAAQLVARLRTFVQPPSAFDIAGKLGEVCRKLAEGAKADEALEIARVLFDVASDSPGTGKPGDPALRRGNARPYIDRHRYERILAQVGPVLAKSAGARWLQLLCDFLRKFLHLERPDSDSGGQDWSYIWYPAIEEDEDSLHGVKCVLVAALRGAAEELIETKTDPKDRVLSIIRRPSFLIFRRIEMYLLSRFPEGCGHRMAELIGVREYYDCFTTRREYQLLVAACFSELPSQIKDRYLAWVNEPCDVDNERKRHQDNLGLTPSDDDLLRDHRREQLRRLYQLREFLSPEWQRRYDSLVQEFGDPTAPEPLLRTHVTWVRPTSPKSQDDLAGMSVDAIAAFLKSWEPEESIYGEPSTEALAETLARVVTAEPQRFGDGAQALQELQPTYVGAVLQGFRDACKAGTQLPWTAILGFCRQILGSGLGPDTADPQCTWARQLVAGLLGVGVESRDAGIPIELRGEIRELLGVLTEDRDPTTQREQEDNSLDPSNLSINSVRGEAMHATIRYALWNRRYFDTHAADQAARGFDAMPEVRDILQRHLDPTVDPSLAIRSVYGQWFPWLATLDECWAAENVGSIFPEDEEHSRFREAAWNTYIVFCMPYTGVYNLMRNVYRWAVDSLPGLTSPRGTFPRDPNEALAEHLLVLYGRGGIALDDSTFIAFWRNADQETREHALTFVGSSLGDESKHPGRDVIERFQELGEDRIRAAPRDISHIDDLVKLGWWFEQPVFDEEWVLARLEEVIELTNGAIDGATPMFERLDEIMPREPQRVLACVRKLIEGDRTRWSIASWMDPLRSILSKGVQSADHPVRESALDSVHYLGSLGFREFRDLAQLQP